MSDMLDDILNLEILEKICDGKGVSVNISALSKSLARHRNTIKSQVMDLLEHKVISEPYYPFIEVFNQRPLFAVVRADLPKTKNVDEFLIEDEAIFASFRSWDEGYNTLLFEYHKDMSSYYNWKETIVKEKRLPPLEHRFPADVLFLNNKLLIKYEPNSSIYKLEEKFKENNEIIINGYKIKELGFQILKKLLRGEGIKTNEHFLAKKSGTHRRTIERRINNMISAEIVSRPVCRFPNFFVPPDHVLVFCFVRINKCKEDIYEYIKLDPSIPVAYHGHTGRYNLLYFGTFPKVEDHFEWEEILHERFSDECFGAMKKVYLSPQVTTSINKQKVALGIIKERKAQIQSE